LRPADEAVAAWSAVVLDDHAMAAVLHGNPVNHRPSTIDHRPAPEARLYARDGRMLTLARYDARRDTWQPGKVFGTPGVSRDVTPNLEIG